MKLTLIVLSFAAILSAQNVVPPAGGEEPSSYGFQRGTVLGFASGGGMHASGPSGFNPAAGAGLEVGLHKYFGLFVDGGWSRASAGYASCLYGGWCQAEAVKANFYNAAAGFEVMGTNHSRFVPYAKIGAGYLDGVGTSYSISGPYSLTASDSTGSLVARFGGGLRTYLTHHVGIDIQVNALQRLGSGGGTMVGPTVGLFFQTK
jgi:hypothetical protein